MLAKQSIFNFEYRYSESIDLLRMEIIYKLNIRLEEYKIDLDCILYINLIVNKIDEKFRTDLKAETKDLSDVDLKLVNKQLKYFPLENEASVIVTKLKISLTMNKEMLILLT